MRRQENSLEIAGNERACGWIVEQAGGLGLIASVKGAHSNLPVTPIGQSEIQKSESENELVWNFLLFDH